MLHATHTLVHTAHKWVRAKGCAYSPFECRSGPITCMRPANKPAECNLRLHKICISHPHITAKLYVYVSLEGGARCSNGPILEVTAVAISASAPNPLTDPHRFLVS